MIFRSAIGVAVLGIALVVPLAAQQTKPDRSSLDVLVSAVVHIQTFINPDGRTVENLGRERDGSGVVIDDSGLVLTIGYLMVEAHAAEIITNAGHRVPADVVGYDHETGFGLLRAVEPLKIKSLPFGKAADLQEQDPVLVASFGGARMVAPVRVVAKRAFAGSWEYLLDDAIFTAPPHPAWSGAALINHDGKLVGIGSLIVGDAGNRGEENPGNMFVPIDRLPPILADLIADGHRSGGQAPWLGITTEERHGRLFVGNVTSGGPAEKAGVRRGDIIVGVNGEKPNDLADFYRRIRALGSAGVTVPLDVMQDSAPRHVDVPSASRLEHLKLKSTF
jgi:S1-C subfamily serine protease